MFMRKWFEEMLVPAVRKLEDSEGVRYKVRLILDNAPYHTTPAPGAVIPDKMKKRDLCSFSDVNDIPYRVGQAPRGDSHAQMIAIVEAWLKERGRWPQGTYVEERAKALGWQVVFTPPYWPEFQPIELYWAAVKGYVADKYTNERTMSELRTQLFEGFAKYGTPEQCTKLIGKALEYEEKYRKVALRKGSFLNPFLIDDDDDETEDEDEHDAGDDGVLEESDGEGEEGEGLE